jgi:UDP-3-O-[3-hydroxymyristoyl] glucosamine N-acyltransferase
VRLHARVVLLRDCILGNRVLLHSGCVIGGDGFGHASQGGSLKKLAHVGRVVLEDDVDIGANSCVDRARFAETRIGAGTKIDNLVQVAHNVTAGRGCIFVAQVGIAGSTRIGDRVVLAGQVGVAGHLAVGSGTQAGAQSGIAGDLAAGSRVRGTPAIPYGEESRLCILRRRLPDLFRRVEKIEKLFEKKESETS